MKYLQEHLKRVIRNIPDFPSPGIQFKDITPVLLDYSLCDYIVDDIIDSFKKSEIQIDCICGIESR